jgi:hypothetical protein
MWEPWVMLSFVPWPVNPWNLVPSFGEIVLLVTSFPQKRLIIYKIKVEYIWDLQPMWQAHLKNGFTNLALDILEEFDDDYVLDHLESILFLTASTCNVQCLMWLLTWDFFIHDLVDGFLIDRTDLKEFQWIQVLQEFMFDDPDDDLFICTTDLTVEM